jgi:protocatechuate 3,4-dioxygenase, beta subunit
MFVLKQIVTFIAVMSLISSATANCEEINTVDYKRRCCPIDLESTAQYHSAHYCDPSKNPKMKHVEKAEASIEDYSICALTPSIYDTYVPKFFYHSNNLIRKNGSPYLQEGRCVLISGVVRDQNCTPVPNAIVEIWQADPMGIRVFENLSNYREDKFDGTGKMVTNNLGEYNFITVMPGAVKDHSPVIHFRVRHSDFLPLETSMFFADNPKNSDAEIKKLSSRFGKSNLLFAKLKNSDSFERSYCSSYGFDITLDGYTIFKKY